MGWDGMGWDGMGWDGTRGAVSLMYGVSWGTSKTLTLGGSMDLAFSTCTVQQCRRVTHRWTGLLLRLLRGGMCMVHTRAHMFWIGADCHWLKLS
jgi:hypothetical protein